MDEKTYLLEDLHWKLSCPRCRTPGYTGKFSMIKEEPQNPMVMVRDEIRCDTCYFRAPLEVFMPEGSALEDRDCPDSERGTDP